MISEEHLKTMTYVKTLAKKESDQFIFTNVFPYLSELQQGKLKLRIVIYQSTVLPYFPLYPHLGLNKINNGV